MYTTTTSTNDQDTNSNSMMSYLTFGAVEWGCMSQLFFDNASTLLGVLGALFNMTFFGVPLEAINEVSVDRYLLVLDRVVCMQVVDRLVVHAPRVRTCHVCLYTRAETEHAASLTCNQRQILVERCYLVAWLLLFCIEGTKYFVVQYLGQTAELQVLHEYYIHCTKHYPAVRGSSSLELETDFQKNMLCDQSSRVQFSVVY